MRIVLGAIQPISPSQQVTASIVISILELDAFGVRNLIAIGLTDKMPKTQRSLRVAPNPSQDNLLHLVQPQYTRAKINEKH
jgi:hypothetical protein